MSPSPSGSEEQVSVELSSSEVTLHTLPLEMLQKILSCIAWHECKADGRIIVPPCAQVSQSFLHALRTAPNRPIRFRKLRCSAESWQTILATADNQIDALAFEESNVRTAALLPLLRASTSLRLLSVYKCYSVDGDALVDELPCLPLEALNLTASNLVCCMGSEGSLSRQLELESSPT